MRRANIETGVTPDKETQTPDWDATPPNYSLIIEHLLHVDGRLDVGT